MARLGSENEELNVKVLSVEWKVAKASEDCESTSAKDEDPSHLSL